MDHTVWLYSLLFARTLFIIPIDSYFELRILDIGYWCVCLKSIFIFISFLEHSSDHIENDTFEWCLTLYALLCLLNESIEFCHYLLLIYLNPLFNIQHWYLGRSGAFILPIESRVPEIKKNIYIYYVQVECRAEGRIIQFWIFLEWLNCLVFGILIQSLIAARNVQHFQIT